MRFCMVTTFYPPYNFGGDGIFVQSLSRALVAHGHDVSVIHCEDAFRLKGKNGNETPDSSGTDGVTVHRLKSRLGLLSPLISQQTGRPGVKSRALVELLSRQYDVINFHNISLMGGPAVLALGHAPVKLYTLHEHWLVCATHVLWKNKSKRCDRRQCFRCSIRSGIPPQLWRFTGSVKKALGCVDALIAPSDFTADQHRRIGAGTPIHVIPHFARLNESYAVDRAERPAEPCFIYVGRVTASKGIVPLLETFSRLPDYLLTIIGSGDLSESLRNRYAGRSNIRFQGFVEQYRLAAYYSAATALILPSLAPESFGLTVVEALACGTPVIVRDSGGCAEIVQRTQAGVVYGTDEELEIAIHKLATDRKFREELSRRAREGFEKCYTVDRYLSEYMRRIRLIRDEKEALASVTPG